MKTFNLYHRGTEKKQTNNERIAKKKTQKNTTLNKTVYEIDKQQKSSMLLFAPFLLLHHLHQPPPLRCHDEEWTGVSQRGG